MRQPWSVSVPAQEAGIAALDEDEYVRNGRSLVAEERTYLEAELKNAGMKFISSNVNFILIYTKTDLFSEMKKRGILIRNCENYRGLGKGWYRIAVRTHEENLRLAEVLRDITDKAGNENTDDKGTRK